MSVQLSVVTTENGGQSAVVIVDGVPFTVDSSHLNYAEIINLAKTDDDNDDNKAKIIALINMTDGILDSMLEVTARVSLRGRTLYFDEEPLPGPLADHIIRLINEGDTVGYESLARFLEKAMLNPGGAKSRDSLWNWLTERKFTIAIDGDFIAYKGVRRSTNNEGENTYASIMSGSAMVNGKTFTGHVPNKVGDIITMNRNDVDSDSNVGCSHGLHAGTWDYAKNFAQGAVLAVKISPADVVSVPTDSAYKKLRVERYTIQSIVDKAFTEPTFKDDEDFYDDEDKWDY